MNFDMICLAEPGMRSPHAGLADSKRRSYFFNALEGKRFTPPVDLINR